MYARTRICHSAKTSCPIPSRPVPRHPNGHLGWNPTCGAEYSIQVDRQSVSPCSLANRPGHTRFPRNLCDKSTSCRNQKDDPPLLNRSRQTSNQALTLSASTPHGITPDMLIFPLKQNPLLPSPSASTVSLSPESEHRKRWGCISGGQRLMSRTPEDFCPTLQSLFSLQHVLSSLQQETRDQRARGCTWSVLLLAWHSRHSKEFNHFTKENCQGHSPQQK